MSLERLIIIIVVTIILYPHTPRGNETGKLLSFSSRLLKRTITNKNLHRLGYDDNFIMTLRPKR